MGKQIKEMTLVGHLQELRVRLMWTIGYFFIALIIGFMMSDYLVRYFKTSPAAENIVWNVFSFTDSIRVYLQFAFLIALALTLPFILFQVWKFVAPGLTKTEQKATIWFIPVAFLLFIIGVLFAYFIIFPMIIEFLSKISSQLEVEETYGISQFFGFMFNIIIPFGLLFELPVIIVFLTRIGVVQPKLLVKVRKFAYLILVAVAAMITPPELVTNILVSIPLILLYEFSIWLSRIAFIRRQKKLASEESLDIAETEQEKE